jgi:hypothetical protein
VASSSLLFPSRTGGGLRRSNHTASKTKWPRLRGLASAPPPSAPCCSRAPHPAPASRSPRPLGAPCGGGGFSWESARRPWRLRCPRRRCRMGRSPSSSPLDPTLSCAPSMRSPSGGSSNRSPPSQISSRSRLKSKSWASMSVVFGGEFGVVLISSNSQKTILSTPHQLLP